MRILALCGSLQSRSANATLLQTAIASAPDGVHITLFTGLRDLPPFDPDLADAIPPHPAVRAWRDALAASDALLIASPEYGLSLPGVLKNAIDHVIGTGEIERKIIGVTAAVKHPDRGRRGIRALCEPLRAVMARIVGGAPIAQGPSFDADVAALVRAIVAEIEIVEEPPAHGLGIALRPSALVAAWVEAFNRADPDALASFYAPDAVNHQVAEAPVDGRDGIRAMFADGFAAAKMTCIVENIFEDGDHAILEWRDPQGLRGCGFFHVKHGVIVAQRGYWDKLTFLRQHGMPLPTR